MAIHTWSLKTTCQKLFTREVRSEDVVRTYLERISSLDPHIHSYLATNPLAVKEAEQLDNATAAVRTRMPLAGAPIAVKDLFDVAGMSSTYGGTHFPNYQPKRTSGAIENLQSKGSVILGKTNLHEYAFGVTSENPHHGNVRNPWDRSKISGGSSGGSAAAVCAGLAVAAIGSDTGGSVRIPASLCGVVGFKPSYGRISTRGALPLAPSLDHVGTLTRTVGDARLLFAAMMNRDAEETIGPPVLPHRIRVGVPMHFFFERCHGGVLQVTQQALRTLELAGYLLDEIAIPDIDSVPEAQSAILLAEAWALHEDRYTAEKSAFGADLCGRLEAGSRVSASQYIKAKQFQDVYQSRLAVLFRQVDVIITPTTPLIATDFGQERAHVGHNQVDIRSSLNRYTNPWNLGGLPAISIPCGLTGGLPVGLQIIGRMGEDEHLLDVAEVIAEHFSWNSIAPEYR